MIQTMIALTPELYCLFLVMMLLLGLILWKNVTIIQPTIVNLNKQGEK